MNDKENVEIIKFMCSFDEFVEMYKSSYTSRVQLIKGVNPVWTNGVVRNVGSKNRIIALIIIQSTEILKAAWFKQEIDKKHIKQTLYECKEKLLACEAISKKIASKVDEIVSEIKKDGLFIKNSTIDFPPVPDLEEHCSNFLKNARLAITYICHLVSILSGLECKDNNFDDLLDSLNNKQGSDAITVQFISEQSNRIRHIIDFRNGDEHRYDSKRDKKTVINNFQLGPNNNDTGLKVIVPEWHLTGEEPSAINEDMENIVDYLLEVAEAIFIRLVAANLKSGFLIKRIPIEEIDSDAPLRYRVNIDHDIIKLPNI